MDSEVVRSVVVYGVLAMMIVGVGYGASPWFHRPKDDKKK